MRRIVRVVVIVALVFLLLVAFMWVFQRRLIYLPTQALTDIAVVLPSAEEVTFPTEDGLTLAAWLLPAARDPNGATVIVFNGNAGNRSDRVPFARALADHGYSVLLVDYRGYGGNPGSPTEDSLLADGRAAVAYLVARPDIDAGLLVYFGESLGAAVAIGVAKQRPPAALVLRSPFASLPDIGAVHYPFLPTWLLMWDRFPNVERIAGIDVPLLIVAGSADSIVPADQSRLVYEAAAQPKKFVMIEGANHNDHALTSGPRLVGEVAAFLDEFVGP